jgi:putative sterol carrier protein
VGAFPSEGWFRSAIEQLNADPDCRRATAGWVGDFGMVIEGQTRTIALYVGEPREGQFPAPEFVSLATLTARAPRYLATASDATWLAMIRGQLDPIAALVQKRLTARGDLEPVVARLKYRGMAERWLQAISAPVD